VRDSLRGSNIVALGVRYPGPRWPPAQLRSSSASSSLDALGSSGVGGGLLGHAVIARPALMSRRQHVAGARCRPPVGGPEDAQNWPIWPLTPRTIRGSQSAQIGDRSVTARVLKPTPLCSLYVADSLCARSAKVARRWCQTGAGPCRRWRWSGARRGAQMASMRCCRLPAASAEGPARAASAYGMAWALRHGRGHAWGAMSGGGRMGTRSGVDRWAG